MKLSAICDAMWCEYDASNSIESVKTTFMWNESTEVLCRKLSTIWNMKIR